MKFWFHTSFAISTVQSIFKALSLALEKVSVKAEEAQTGEVEKEAEGELEEEKQRRRIKEGMHRVMYKDYTIES